jgi:hypothetical protein
MEAGHRMSNVSIYSGPLGMFGAKVEIAGREKGIAFDLVMVPLDFTNGYAPGEGCTTCCWRYKTPVRTSGLPRRTLDSASAFRRTDP